MVLDRIYKIVMIGSAVVIAVSVFGGALMWVGGIRSDVGHLQRDVKQLQGDVDKVQTDFNQLQKAISQIQVDVAAIKAHQGLASEHAGQDGDAQEERRADTTGAAAPKQGDARAPDAAQRKEQVKGEAP